MTGFAAYASRARLLAMALSMSFMKVAFQAPLGLGSAGAFAREVAAVDGTFAGSNGRIRLRYPKSCHLGALAKGSSAHFSARSQLL